MEIYKDLKSEASQQFEKLLNSQLSKNKIDSTDLGESDDSSLDALLNEFNGEDPNITIKSVKPRENLNAEIDLQIIDGQIFKTVYKMNKNNE